MPDQGQLGASGSSVKSSGDAFPIIPRAYLSHRFSIFLGGTKNSIPSSRDGEPGGFFCQRIMPCISMALLNFDVLMYRLIFEFGEIIP